MEFNNRFIENLKAAAHEIIVEGNELVKIAILLDHGNAGEVVKMNHNGEWVYSFMSEDELYKRMTGMTKDRYTMQQQSIKDKEKYEKNRFILAYSGKWKDEFKKHYAPEDFKKVDSIITSRLNQEADVDTLALYVSLAKVYYILKATEESTMNEVAGLYYGINTSVQERVKDPAIYFLTKADKGEFYTHLIYEDFAAVTGEYDLNKLEKMVSKKSKEIEAQLSVVSSQPGKN